MRLYRVKMPKRSRLRFFSSEESKREWLELRGLEADAAEPVRRREILFAIVCSLNPVLLFPILILAVCSYFGTKQYLDLKRALDTLDKVGRHGTAIVTRESGAAGKRGGRVMEYAFQPHEGEVVTGSIHTGGMTSVSKHRFVVRDELLPPGFQLGSTFPVRFDPKAPGFHAPDFTNRALLAEERASLKTGLIMMGAFAGFLMLILLGNALGVLAGLADERARPKRRSRIAELLGSLFGKKSSGPVE